MTGRVFLMLTAVRRCARTQSACHSCCFWGREEKRRLVVFVTDQAEQTGEAQE